MKAETFLWVEVGAAGGTEPGEGWGRPRDKTIWDWGWASGQVFSCLLHLSRSEKVGDMET